MKIAIFVGLFPPKWLAGTEIATYNMADHLAQRGHEVHVITSHDAGLPELSKENDFYIHRIPGPKIRFIGIVTFWVKICLKIRKIKPDIFHAQSLLCGIPALATKNFLKIPYVIWGQGSDIYLPGRFTRITSKPILQNADAVLALTENMKQKMREIYDREISIVPNGIDLERFKISPESKKKDSTKTIIFVGRLHPVKGVQYLIEAMAIVHQESPEVKLILVGDGEERELLENLTDSLGIRECVEFAGRVPHERVQDYMNQAEVFVLPSLSEGFPVTILEAMACGLPIVATQVGGVPDVIKNGVNGYLVKAKDPNETVEALLKLLQDAQLRATISKTNKQKVDEYSWGRVALALEKIYRESIELNSSTISRS